MSSESYSQWWIQLYLSNWWCNFIKQLGVSPRLKRGSILTLDHMRSPLKIKILDMEPNFNTGTGVIKGWRHQVDQGLVVCVYGDLAIVKVEVQFVNGVVNGVCFFLNGAQNFHYVFCLSKTDTHKLLIHWNISTTIYFVKISVLCVEMAEIFEKKHEKSICLTLYHMGTRAGRQALIFEISTGIKWRNIRTKW